MNDLLVLLVWSVCTWWMLRRDAKERPSVSSDVWIVVIWIVICSSRPVTSWFGLADPAASRDEGNLAEASVYMALIAAALFVLVRRGVSVSEIIKDNSWLFVFYLFWCLSVVWSEYPVITLRRLIKDLGNVAMVLVLLTSPAPREAIKAAFVRCAYVCIPLSIVLIRYFPEAGRAYVGYHKDDMFYLGVATHKNALGMLCAVAAVFILLDLLELPRTWRRGTSTDRVGMAVRGVVLSMCWYLLVVVNSATSLVCAAISSFLLIGIRRPLLRGHPGRVEGYGIIGGLVIWSVDAVFNVKETFVQSLGRDMTLTTRTDMWPLLIQHQDNPLLGAGFNSFWTGSRLAELGGLFGGIIQAHNGYLETYLNGGWVGVALLLTLLGWAYMRIRRELLREAPDGGVRLVFLLLAIMHNVAEASFSKLSILWFATVLVIMEVRPRSRPRPVRAVASRAWDASREGRP